MHAKFSWEKYPSVQEGVSRETVSRLAEEFIKKLEEARAMRGRGGFEEVLPARVIDAVYDDAERERMLETLNPLVERNVASIRFSRELADYFYIHGARAEERSRIAELWRTVREEVKKLPLEDPRGYIHGVQGMVAALTLLPHLGYDMRHARPVEDALAATDAIARHKKFPNAYLLIQVESPGTPDFYADTEIPRFSGGESRDIVEKRMTKARKIKAYARALSERYGQQFFPVLLSVPRFETNDGIDPITGRPSAQLLDKYSRDDILEKAVAHMRR